MSQSPLDPNALGPNAWLVDEMREQYRDNPASVPPSWRVLFDGEERRPPSPAPAAPAIAAPAAPPAPAGAHLAPPPPAPAGSTTDPLKGVAARIVANMEASLGVPTATSVRDVPAKLLEVQRNIVNRHLARTRGGKVSFTHLIAYAVIKALGSVPAMKNTYAEDDKGNPLIVRHPHVGLGMAVDVANADGSRSLFVPVIKAADSLSFREFWEAYESLIRKVRNRKLSPDDMSGATVTITNPGTIGTRHSVPRLMPGQGVIVGVGAIDYPAQYAGADPAKLAEIGIGKIVTLTSTYDHRIIQGAESGLFLDEIRRLLMGEEGFYEHVFESLGVPYMPASWMRDQNPADHHRAAVEKTAAIQELLNAYRSRGHLISDLDPLDAKGPQLPAELDPRTYGLSVWDLERTFYVGEVAGGKGEQQLGALLGLLRDAYCRTVGIEYMHIMDPEQKRWIQRHIEGADTVLATDEQRHILDVLGKAESFEKFLHKRYTGQKRFGLEGAESAIVVLDAVLDAAGTEGIAEAVIGMPHRGRLNTLVNVVGKSVNQVFREFEDMTLGTVYGGGDVKYHMGATGKYSGLSGNAVAVSLAPNPSHLEAVDPVVEGIVRAKLDEINDRDAFPVLPLLMHGDAAFAGQGVIAETLNLSQLKGYKTGGTIHLVINNQVGFTTNPESSRSSVYCTDVAKMVQAPVFHVNGDDPEACFRVGRLAFAFRQAFQKDVVIDMVCYRKHGHNEGDEPRYTQPLMYERIDNRPSVRELYARDLVGRGDISQEEADRAAVEFEARMQRALDETRAEHAEGSRKPANADDRGSPWDQVPTGVDRATLDRIARATHTWPEGFNAHPKLARQLEQRAQTYEQAGEVDWALGEAMAYGSMLLEGRTVRLAGQDSRRGTFSHRQAVMVDSEDGAEHTPLEALAGEAGGRFYIYDSSLSEYAALGFEYGYTVANPDAFVAWEAQFGDFVNGAQIMVDQFIVSSETKWEQQSQLVMLLPHGYEGQGPEHSSARPERFLQLCAEDNIRVVNVTSSAQLFHVLRRQVLASERKPLVVMAPKSGLRARQTRSHVDELVNGRFREVIDDAAIADPLGVQRIVFCTGKVAWDAQAARDAAAPGKVAVVRVEQLYPWPGAQIADVIDRYPNSTEMVWMQEEPENQGYWFFVQLPLWELWQKTGRRLSVIARPPSSSPATGSHHQHDHELDRIKERVTSGL